MVGYLEEEAVKTYAHLLHDLDAGKLPQWTNLPAPDIAKQYWKMVRWVPAEERRDAVLTLALRAGR
jgi:hypothetical protein